ncbi:hypothetical protein D9M71_391820 [compost metagenome]
MQFDSLAVRLAQLQLGNAQAAVAPWQQGDDPAGAGAGFAVKGVQAVQLARAAYLEVAFQGAQVGLAELGDVLAFQGQLQAFASFQAGTVDAGLQQRFSLGQHGPQQGEEKDAEATHRGGS